MLFEEIKKINDSEKKIREFGYVVGGAVVGLGIVIFLLGGGLAVYFLDIGALLIFWGLFFPVLILYHCGLSRHSQNLYIHSCSG